MGLVVGIDLGHEYAQISYFESSMKEPETVSVLTGVEKYKIPTVLCKQHGRDYFSWGEEAKMMALKGQGILVADLLREAMEKESISIGNDVYETKQLLVIFLRKLWNSLTRVIGDKKVERCVITVEKTGREILEILDSVIPFLPVEPECVTVQSQEESFYSYALLQKHMYDGLKMVLLEEKQEGLQMVELEFSNGKAVTTKKILDFSSAYDSYGNVLNPEKLDRTFAGLMQQEMQYKKVAFIYLIGDLFEKEWMKESVVYLCGISRVFQGSNLYVKGSAVAAMAKLENWVPEYRYEGTECLTVDLGIMGDVLDGDFVPLVKRGQFWFQAEKSMELVLEDVDVLEIGARTSNGDICSIKKFSLDGISDGNHYITAVKVHIFFESMDHASITVEDLGFGETTISSGKIWAEDISSWEKLL